MRLGAPREIYESEARVAMTPDSAQALQKLGYECLIETGAGKSAGFSDEAYRAAGVPWWRARMRFTRVPISSPRFAAGSLRDRSAFAGQDVDFLLLPAQNQTLLQQAKDKGAAVIAMDMVPRISRAQKMDALSSMANIAGYRAVIEAGNNFGRFFTGQ